MDHRLKVVKFLDSLPESNRRIIGDYYVGATDRKTQLAASIINICINTSVRRGDSTTKTLSILVENLAKQLDDVTKSLCELAESKPFPSVFVLTDKDKIESLKQGKEIVQEIEFLKEEEAKEEAEECQNKQ